MDDDRSRVVLVPPAELIALIRRVFENHGARSSDAQLVAELLTDADLSGYESHGAVKAPGYVEKLISGDIDPDAELETVVDRPAVLSVDAAWGFGPPAAVHLVDALVERASAVGVAAGTIHRCNDLGRLAPYVERAARRGYIAVLAANDGGYYPQVAPWGGTEALFGTNPIAFAAPVDGELPISFDMSTSALAAGKLLLAASRGQQAPSGTMIDADGKASSDPRLIASDSKRGSILPLGAPAAGHKGYALAIMVDVLAGALTGSGTSADRADRHVQGVFVQVVDPAVFTELASYDERMLRLRRAVHDAPTAADASSPHLPGEGAEKTRSERLVSGVGVDSALWGRLQELAGTHEGQDS